MDPQQGAEFLFEGHLAVVILPVLGGEDPVVWEIDAGKGHGHLPTHRTGQDRSVRIFRRFLKKCGC
jgi:hypothetical protein